MIDRTQLEAIAAGEPELVLDILEEFARDAAELISKASRMDAPAARKVYHQLLGASGTLGLQGVSQLAREFEISCLDGVNPLNSALNDLLEESINDARALLLSWSKQ